MPSFLFANVGDIQKMQWLFDIIFEWVEAKAYATMTWVQANFYTQAQVEEWSIPMHVTGTLDPNSTCTYHKGGIYNGKPYYDRNDGEWTIWWDSGLSLWTISYDTGVIMGPRWRRIDPDIEGNYVAAGGASGVATVTAGYGCPKLCFVDRGDPASADWREGVFVADNTWRDLNLDIIVPDGAKMVTFTLWLRNTLVNKDMYLREKGNVNSSNISSIRTQVGNVFVMLDLVCPCDANRKVQYWLAAGGAYTIYLSVKGWWY